MVAAFSGAVFLGALAAEAPAQPSGCIQDGQIVTFDGVASTGGRESDASRSAWVLNLSRPICVLRRVPFGPGAMREEVSAIRIIGTPPPLGVPLALTGKLLLGRSSPGATLFVALEVIHGRKLDYARRPTPPAPASPPATIRQPLAAPQPARPVEARCDRPPYGGSPSAYQAFVQRFGSIIKPEKILAGICNAKFGNAPRDGLHKLGFTDAKIESESTEQLAAETIHALKTLVNTIE